MENESVIITEKLVKAVSLDQFRAESGKARLNMPYWIALEGGEMLFNFIHSKTDRMALEMQIRHGLIFIQEKYAKSGEAENGNEG